MTRAERSARNKRVHAIRRALTDADYREARAAGTSISWRAVWDTYASLDADAILALEGEAAKPAAKPAAPAKPRRKRAAPAHVAAASAEYRLAREVWERGLEEAMRGARPDGKPARGEDRRYTDEERDYRAAHPAPVFKTFMQEAAARCRADRDEAASA